MRFFMHTIECDHPGCLNKFERRLKPDNDDGYTLATLARGAASNLADALAIGWTKLTELGALCPDHASDANGNGWIKT